MRWLKPIFGILLMLAVFLLLNFRQQQIPPLGKFLNPFAGFWQNNTAQDELPTHLFLPGLQDTVHVLWDDRRVPHIFAENEPDLYFAQGYLTARDRLWQMEFQTHAAAGRLAEIVGARGLEHDRFRRRLGMVYAAENALAAMRADSATWQAAAAYARGVNAWISNLPLRHLPLEYKILDYRPEAWTVMKSALLLKLMAWRLTSRNEEVVMSRTAAALGDSLTRLLHPGYPPFMEPIVPAETQWQFVPAAVPQPGHEFKYVPPADASLSAALPARGSNNWAVAGSRTASGYPILCNDPHLTLNLPAIWYEVQLAAPTVNVYGVSLPGAPAVVIGFNQQVAWGVTNAESDVMDWYHIVFQDSTRQAYFHDGAWRPTAWRVEEIKIRGGAVVRDSIPFTHHGPVAYRASEKPFTSDMPRDAALRWLAHDASNELATFLKLNRSRNYSDFLAALEHYACPAQNFAFADSAGTIALWHHGRFPLRWPEQGRTVSDGSDRAYDWPGWIARAHLPHTVNPGRGFVSSANQNPVADTYPYYLGGEYAAFERGARINSQLAAMTHLRPEDMQALQNDVVDLHAATVLPALLAQLPPTGLTPEQAQARAELEQWNYEFQADQVAPAIFAQWWRALQELIWEDEWPNSAGGLKRPRRDVTVDLILREPQSPYFDRRNTAARETLPDLAWLALQSAVRQLGEKFGPVGPAWQWGQTRGTDLRHLADIPGLGRLGLRSSGNYTCVNAITNTTGPSWRMIAALGPQPQAWVIYPGGQSGNPGSQFYDNFVDDWLAGKSYAALYLKSHLQTDDRLIGRTILRGRP